MLCARGPVTEYPRHDHRVLAPCFAEAEGQAFKTEKEAQTSQTQTTDSGWKSQTNASSAIIAGDHELASWIDMAVKAGQVLPKPQPKDLKNLKQRLDEVMDGALLRVGSPEAAVELQVPGESQGERICLPFELLDACEAKNDTPVTLTLQDGNVIAQWTDGIGGVGGLRLRGRGGCQRRD